MSLVSTVPKSSAFSNNLSPITLKSLLLCWGKKFDHSPLNASLADITALFTSSFSAAAISAQGSSVVGLLNEIFF